MNIITTAGNIHQMEQVTRNFSWWHDAESMELLIRGWIRCQRKTTEEAGGAIVAAQLLHEWTSLAKTALSSSTTTANTTTPIVYPSLKIVRTVLMALADRGEYEMAIRLLEQRLHQDSAEVGLQPGKGSLDRDCFHRVLQACCNAGALDQAWMVVEIMKNGHHLHSQLVTGILPNRSTYKVLLQTHVNHHSMYKTRGTGLKAYRLFQEMEQPDQVSYNITLNALAQEGCYEQAEELFFQLLESIDSKETMVDPIPIRTVLKACAKANSHKAANRAENLVKTLQSLPCVDARAYSTVVAMWCKLGQPERAKLLLAELTSMYLDSPPTQPPTQNNRWKPDPMSFRTVIGAFSQKVESIMGPSNINYYGKKHWNEAKILATLAQEVFMDMYTIMKYDPNLITCNAILKCWCQARQPEVAEDFLQQMLQWDMSPDIVSYNTIIACYGKLGNVDACTAWLSKMAQPESPFPSPNTRTVTAVITALSKRGTKDAAEQAEAWFMHMQEWHADWGWDCSPNQVTLNALLGCWARIGNGHRAESILRQFQSYHCNCNLNNNSNINSSTSNHTVSPDIVSYNTVIHAYRNDMIKIQCLLQDLIAAGLQPNKRTVELVRTAMEQDPSIQDKTLKWYELKQRYFYFTNTTTGSSNSTTTTTTKKSKAN